LLYFASATAFPGPSQEDWGVVVGGNQINSKLNNINLINLAKITPAPPANPPPREGPGGEAGG